MPKSCILFYLLLLLSNSSPFPLPHFFAITWPLLQSHSLSEQLKERFTKSSCALTVLKLDWNKWEIGNLEKYMLKELKLLIPEPSENSCINYWGNSYTLPIFCHVYFRTNLHQQKLGILQMTDVCENEISPLNLL